LGGKLHYSLPVLQISKPFQKYYRKARELREGHSVRWNEVLLADSRATSRTSVCIKTKEAVATPPVKTFAGLAGSAKKGFLRKGFLNLSPAVIAPTISHSLIVDLASSLTQEVKVDGVIGLLSLLSCINPSFVEGNGLFQSQVWQVGFDPSEEVVVWEQNDKF
jgi:hypothetical protein